MGNARVLRSVVVENDLVSATIALDRGADVVSLVYRPRNIDVLWKARRASRPPPGVEASVADWRRNYPGGWQTILPNFGPAHEHGGRWLEMHGEAARVPWMVEQLIQDGDTAEIAVTATLHTAPFGLRRVLRVRTGEPAVRITEIITNVGERSAECMWGHHPAFGPPFLSPVCTVDTGARTVEPDPGFVHPACDLDRGARNPWPEAPSATGEPVDLSRPPAPGAGVSRVVTLSDFAAPWYAITNDELSFGIGLTWSADQFPYACMWQEAGGVTDEPLSGEAYVLAIEPHSSFPGHGLAAVVASTGTHLTLAPGEQRSANLCAVFYDGPGRVADIDSAGRVTRA